MSHRTSIQSGVAALPTGEVWMAGEYDIVGHNPGPTLITALCPIHVSDAGFEPASARATPNTQLFWSLDPMNTMSHTITDGSGLDLFDSGPKGPGTSFSVSYFAAGTYEVLDSATSNSSVIQVRMSAVPPSGSTTTIFTVRWASVVAPVDFKYRVQIKRPGERSFGDWFVGLARSRTFLPDGGVGTYAFRGRLERISSGASSGWSPTVSIRVS